MTSAVADPKAIADDDPVIKSIVGKLEAAVKAGEANLEAKFAAAQAAINTRLGEQDAKLASSIKAVDVPGAEDATYKGEKFNLGRACAAIAMKNWRVAPLEREIFDASKKAADAIPGFYERNSHAVMPDHVGKSTMVTTIDAQGGEIIPIQLMPNLIENFRARSIIEQLGATTLMLNKMIVRIPKKTGNTTAYWIGENHSSAVTQSEPTLGHIEARPHKCAGLSKASTWMGDYSDPGVWPLLQADLMDTIALAVDLAGFKGLGSAGQPLGLIGQLGSSQTVDFTGSPSAALVSGTVPYEYFEKLVDMEELLRTANALVDGGRYGYAMHPLVYKTIRKIRSSARSTTVPVGDVSRTVIEESTAPKTINGHPFRTTTQLTGTSGSADIVFGNWADFVKGMWGSAIIGPTNILNDDAAKFINAIVVAIDVDWSVRHVESFSKGSNVPAVT